MTYYNNRTAPRRLYYLSGCSSVVVAQAYSGDLAYGTKDRTNSDVRRLRINILL